MLLEAIERTLGELDSWLNRINWNWFLESLPNMVTYRHLALWWGPRASGMGCRIIVTSLLQPTVALVRITMLTSCLSNVPTTAGGNSMALLSHSALRVMSNKHQLQYQRPWMIISIKTDYLLPPSLMMLKLKQTTVLKRITGRTNI